MGCRAVSLQTGAGGKVETTLPRAPTRTFPSRHKESRNSMARLSWLSLQKRDAVGEANLGSPGGALASCGDALGCHELLQLTGLKHFHHDVAAADEFALHI